MPLDPLIPLRTRNPNIASPMDSYARALRVKGMGQQNEINELDLASARRQERYEKGPGYQRQLQKEQEAAEFKVREARASMTIKERELSDKNAAGFAHVLHPIFHMNLSKRQAELRPTLDRALEGKLITQEQHQQFSKMSYPQLEKHMLKIYKDSKLHQKIGAEMRGAKEEREAAKLIAKAKVDAATNAPQSQTGASTKTIGDRIYQWNPDTTRYDIDIGPRPPSQANDTGKSAEQKRADTEHKHNKEIERINKAERKEVEGIQKRSNDLMLPPDQKPNYNQSQDLIREIHARHNSLRESENQRYQTETGGGATRKRYNPETQSIEVY